MKTKITAEWTEACRSGSCSFCFDGDEVLWIEADKSERTKPFRLCSDCALQLITVLQDKGINKANNLLLKAWKKIYHENQS